jgi:type II secretory pathway pseudopilin PulG
MPLGMQTKKVRRVSAGFSLIELLLAGAIFVIFATGIVEVLLSGLAADRLGEETTIATEYAAEGMEALRSLKAKNFDELSIAAATGIARVSGNWILSDADNTFGKYTRIIVIEEVRRGADGNIDENGGTTDPDTKKVTVTVAWNVTPTRTNSVILNTFLTRFK